MMLSAFAASPMPSLAQQMMMTMVLLFHCCSVVGCCSVNCRQWEVQRKMCIHKACSEWLNVLWLGKNWERIADQQSLGVDKEVLLFLLWCAVAVSVVLCGG